MEGQVATMWNLLSAHLFSMLVRPESIEAVRDDV